MITAPDFTREMLVEVEGVSKKFQSGYVRLAIKQVDVSMFSGAPLLLRLEISIVVFVPWRIFSLFLR